MLFKYPSNSFITEEEMLLSEEIYKLVNRAKMTAIRHKMYDKAYLKYEWTRCRIPERKQNIRMYWVIGVEIKDLEEPPRNSDYLSPEEINQLLTGCNEYYDERPTRAGIANTESRQMPLREYFDKRKELLNDKAEDEKLNAICKSDIRQRIEEYVKKPGAYARFDEEVNSRILGQPNLSQITYNIFSWLRGIATGATIKNNVLLAAPSGCGKTETYRVIKDILDREIGGIPVIQLDTTKLTPEGYRGMNTAEFFEPLIRSSDNGVGIVLLDELDKKLIPSISSSGDNVNLEVQSQILTIIEGCEVSCRYGTINTANTLFIGAGAFQKVRDTLASNRRSTIGFGEKEETDSEKIELDMEEIMNAGAMKELMGRFTSVINLYKLDRPSVFEVINRYKKEFEELLGCEIVYSDDALEKLYHKYANSGLGCRILKSVMWEQISLAAIELERKNYLGRKRKVTILVDGESVTYQREQVESTREFCVAG